MIGRIWDEDAIPTYHCNVNIVNLPAKPDANYLRIISLLDSSRGTRSNLQPESEDDGATGTSAIGDTTG